MILNHQNGSRWLRRFEKDDGKFGSGGGDTAVLEPAEFQKKVLGGVEALSGQIKSHQQKIDEITSNVGNVHKDTKDALERFTQLKNEQATITEQMLAFRKLHLQLNREVRMAHGDPIKRLQANEEFVTYLNAAVRVHLGYGHVLSEPQKKALDEANTPGSTMINQALAREIYDALPNYGIWNTLAVVPLGTKTNLFPVDTADPVASFIDEAGTISDDTNFAGTAVTLTVKKIAALVNVSRELLQDSEFDVTAIVMRKFLRAAGKRMDHAAFIGDGVSDASNGGFTGVFNFGTVITAATGNTTVETLDYEDVLAVPLGIAEGTLGRALRWWMHPFILFRMTTIKDGNGRPIFLTAIEAPTTGGIGSLLGYPITTGHILPTTNAAATKIAAFGDPDAYVVGVRQDVEIDSSDHARWTTDQRSFRLIARAGFKGRLATALTILKTAAS